MVQTRLPAGQDQILALLAGKVKSVLFFKLSAGKLESFGKLRESNVVAPRDFPIVLQLVGVPHINQDRSAFTEQGSQLLKSDDTHVRVHCPSSERKLRSRTKIRLEQGASHPCHLRTCDVSTLEVYLLLLF